VKYFLVYLFLEVMVSVNLASFIGAIATFAEIVISAIIGFALLLNVRNTLMQNLNALVQRQMSAETFQKLNLWSIVSALLLILPGFFGDIVAVCLQFSAITTLFAQTFLHVKKENQPFYSNYSKQGNEHEVIDVEVIDDRRLK